MCHVLRQQILALFALGIAGLVATVLLAPARADLRAPDAGYGFSMYGGNIQLSSEDLNRELDAVSRTNATWIRVIFDSFRVETAKGQYDWKYTDLVVNSARAHGLNVLATVSYSQAWALRPGDRWSAPPTNPDDFAAFASAAAGHYNDRVSSWEIWNEPNKRYYFTYDGDSATRYAELLKASYVAIKKVQPNSTILTGGLSPRGEIAPPEFIQRLYEAGAKDYFDAIGMHPYVFPGGLVADPYRGWSDVGRVHGIMSAHGDDTKRIWMTELGAPTTAGPLGVSQEEQAKQITDVLHAAAATGYSGPAFIFTIRDAPGRKTEGDYSFGALLTADWQAKAAAQALAGTGPYLRVLPNR